MRINLEWLGDFADVPSVRELSDLLASAGLEVDAVSDPSAHVSDVVVGQVTEVGAHPEADRLHVCAVHDGETTHSVVCGAPNIAGAAGQRVALARVGAALPGGSVKRRKLRGVESGGMICSRAELGLEDKSDGVWLLPETWELGASVLEQARITATLELSVTPNRPDLLSHLGVAREVAAGVGRRLKPPKIRLVEKGPDVGHLARVVVEDPVGCKRYCARVVRGLSVGPSPEWLRRRLESVGQRSINNIVDVTNYVLMELWQPLHAFDLARLTVEAGCPTIHVRRAQKNETITTLDGVERELSTDDVVIADPNRAVALAGVMGGADTEVTESTTAVLIESAYFDPVAVRRCARRQGLHTESSHRFERGSDPGMAAKAADRCAQLLADVAGGEVAKGIIDVAQKHEPPREVTLRLERVSRILGVSLPAETVVQLLDPLEIRCTARNESQLRFHPPTFRPDLTREVDLLEELARRHGYDRIPDRLPDASSAYGYEAPQDDRTAKARACLLSSGCSEAITYGFGSPQHHAGLFGVQAEPVRLMNPLGEEMSAMRATLVPGLLTALAHNQRHGGKHVRLFEIGTTFHRRDPAPEEDERDRALPREELRVACVLHGGRHQGRWYEGGQMVDFSDLAGLVEGLGEAYGLAEPVERRPASVAGFNPHCAAELFLADEKIGIAGQVHPDTVRQWEITGPVYAMEISLEGLAAGNRWVAQHRPLPKFPGTRRDIALMVKRDVPAERLQGFLLRHAGGSLGRDVVERVRLFDVYEGKSIPKDHVSLAFAIEYRSRERTLTDAEVTEAFESVIGRLKEEFSVEVRS